MATIQELFNQYRDQNLWRKWTEAQYRRDGERYSDKEDLERQIARINARVEEQEGQAELLRRFERLVDQRGSGTKPSGPDDVNTLTQYGFDFGEIRSEPTWGQLLQTLRRRAAPSSEDQAELGRLRAEYASRQQKAEEYLAITRGGSPGDAFVNYLVRTGVPDYEGMPLRDRQILDAAGYTSEPAPGTTGPVIGEETVVGAPDTGSFLPDIPEAFPQRGDGGSVVPGDPGGPGTGIGDGGEAVTTELTAEQQEFFRKQFGGLAFFMEKAELYDIVLQVAREGITDVNRVLGLVQETDWYQNNSALTRRFDVLYAEEGDAGQRELIDDQYEAINSAARNVGFVIEDDRLQELAYQASRLGLDAGEVADLIAAEQNFDPGYLGDSAKQLANKYYISLDDASADEYGTQLFVGDMNQQMLESMFREQAKGRFPSLANIIDSGVSPQTYFAPYKAQIAQLLEIDANQVDLMNDTRFSTIIDHIPDAGGEARPMTMNEMQRYVRRLDDWQYTDNAKASASRLADAIGARFGRTA